MKEIKIDPKKEVEISPEKEKKEYVEKNFHRYITNMVIIEINEEFNEEKVIEISK